MREVPFSFVLENLERLSPYTKPMFGALGVYVGDKIVVILRDRETSPEDNGIWLATTPEHHASLQKDLPSMRSIAMFGPGPTGWQTLPVDSDRFEEDALRACEIILAGDPRIGKVPKRKLSAGRGKSKAKAKPKTKAKPAARKKKKELAKKQRK